MKSDEEKKRQERSKAGDVGAEGTGGRYIERERARVRGGTDVMERNKKCLNDNGVQRKRGRGSER